MPFTRILTSVTQLGIPFDEVIRMSYSRVVMYLMANAPSESDYQDITSNEQVRNAKQQDINNWI